jgi:hypothetical protein
LTEVWIDQPAYLAAAYAHSGDHGQAAKYLALFVEAFSVKIMRGPRWSDEQIVEWIMRANPFKHEADTATLVQGLVKAGLAYEGAVAPEEQDAEQRAEAPPAVTWRIRSAIQKIASAHQTLGRHLANSIHTGLFCSYTPEKEIDWKI